ncbi:thioredoxin family protein [Bradyrhizobium sp. SZCCHNS3053]|uniref:thioredoxin family protein n=1 Tax=Bradyrhizobium sp. SZCCHNS3053 TaxID=3057322 RepID=UPI0029160C4D|nr:thioredoxin family protein [Bradyrhizobium sp. SZCCHNS3053]
MKAITDVIAVSDLAATAKPIVIKFEAKWCQPCKAMTPTLQAIEKDFGDRVEFYAANVEQCPLMAQFFGISQIPALASLVGGTVTGTRKGAGSKQEIVQWMTQSIASLRDER